MWALVRVFVLAQTSECGLLRLRLVTGSVWKGTRLHWRGVGRCTRPEVLPGESVAVAVKYVEPPGRPVPQIDAAKFPAPSAVASLMKVLPSP